MDPWVGKIPLEKEMTAHSNILAWEIPLTEEPGGLPHLFRGLRGIPWWGVYNSPVNPDPN